MGVVALYFTTRIFICDSFIVSGPSMEPTFNDRERVMAFKTGIGARIYTKYNFADPKLHSFRMPGLRKLRRGDVAVFNYPYGAYPGTISFKINYVLIKRCAGAPGDTVQLDGLEPCYVPARGDRIILDSANVVRYSRQIEFETGMPPEVGGEHTFSTDWFFFIGDNFKHSRDSRHFGLVPESYIVGRVRQKRSPN